MASSDKTSPDPVAEMKAAEARGDNAAVRRLARQILEHGEALPEEARAQAKEALEVRRIHPVYWAYLVGGLVVWGVIFWLGVIARQ